MGRRYPTPKPTRGSGERLSSLAAANAFLHILKAQNGGAVGGGALKTQEWKTWHQIARVENAGMENAAPSSRGGKRGSGK